MLLRLHVALALVAALAACSGDPSVPARTSSDSGLAAFPTMPWGIPPGASPAARTTAAALGRGVNFGNMMEAPNEGDWGLWVTQEFIDSAWVAGFRSIRLPVRWSSHAAATPPYTIDPYFMNRVQMVVDHLLEKGFYVVMDMHHHQALMGDTSATSGDVPVDTTRLDVRYLTMWRQISERFADRSDHLVFELLNEPFGRLDAFSWNVLAARALRVVRQRNPHRIVMIGPVDMNIADRLATLQLPNDADLIVTIHDYDPVSFTFQGASFAGNPPTGVTCCNAAQQAAMITPLTVAKAWADAKHYPIYIGEFGAYYAADTASRARYMRIMRDEAEARGFTWGYWEFAAGFGVYDPTAHRLRRELVDALLGD